MFEFLQPYVAKLEIKRSICYKITDNPNCQCGCDGNDWVIYVNRSATKDTNHWLPMLVHELCHLAMGETFGKIFVQTEFSSKYIYPSLTFPDQKMAMLGFIKRAGEDVWVNRVRHQYFPELTRQEAENLHMGIYLIWRKEPGAIGNNLELLTGLSLQCAENDYYGLDHDYRKIINSLGPAKIEIFRRLRNLFRGLPEITDCPESERAANMEEMVRSGARILGFPINPRLVWEDGRGWVWEV